MYPYDNLALSNSRRGSPQLHPRRSCASCPYSSPVHPAAGGHLLPAEDSYGPRDHASDRLRRQVPGEDALERIRARNVDRDARGKDADWKGIFGPWSGCSKAPSPWSSGSRLRSRTPCSGAWSRAVYIWLDWTRVLFCSERITEYGGPGECGIGCAAHSGRRDAAVHPGPT
jgi:hypothetical protein